MVTSFALRGWEAASLIAFFYAAVVAAFLRPGLSASVRFRATGASIAGIGLTAASIVAPANVVLHAWVLPPVLLLLFYWTTGLLFVSPMTAVEDAFLRIDRALRIRDLGAHTPKWLVEILELAYAGVYGLIPIALALHLRLAAAPDAIDSGRSSSSPISSVLASCLGFRPGLPERSRPATHGRRRFARSTSESSVQPAFRSTRFRAATLRKGWRRRCSLPACRH
jgi:hypothetical protein